MKTRQPARPGGGRSGPPSRPPRGGGSRPPPAPRPPADLLYGRNAVREALRAGRRRPRQLLLAEHVREDDRIKEIVGAAERAGITIERVPRPLLDDWLGPVNHQGLALEGGPYPYAAWEDALATPGTVLLLDHLQDPQNFGTLLRAADAAGVVAVVIPRDRAVEVTPAVVNASAGAVEHLTVCRVPNLARAIEGLKEAGWWSAALDTGPGAIDLFTADLPTPLALVVGGEGTGVGPNVRRHCDLVLSLPMAGRVASLNAATAGAIALFDLVRRSRAGAVGRSDRSDAS